MVEAQRFPWGTSTDPSRRRIYGKRSRLEYGSDLETSTTGIRDGQAILSAARIELCHNAAFGSCDIPMASKDGIIGGPCFFFWGGMDTIGARWHQCESF